MAMKTPGVYIVEKNAFPNSIVEVATAVPAFIGYTERADNGGNSLLGRPWRIASMAEYERYFGVAPEPVFQVKRVPDAVKPEDRTKAKTEATEAAKALKAAQEAVPKAEKALADSQEQKGVSDKEAALKAATEKASATGASDDDRKSVETLTGELKMLRETLAGAQATKDLAQARKGLAEARAGEFAKRMRLALLGEEADVPPAAAGMDKLRVQVSEFKLKDKSYRLTRQPGAAGKRFLMHQAMRHFFQNGGGPCYVVSVGDYKGGVIEAGNEKSGLKSGLVPLVKEQEPTMVVVPDAVSLSRADCVAVQVAALTHCGYDMKSRVAILDIWGGDLDRQDPAGSCIDGFRNDIGINFLDYAAAYYPWLHTSLMQAGDFKHWMIDSADDLAALVWDELDLAGADAGDKRAAERLAALRDLTRTGEQWAAKISALIDASSGTTSEQKDKAKKRLADPTLLKDDIAPHRMLLDKSLIAMSELYTKIRDEALVLMNLMPPSAAMAGLYTMVDNTRGVWKAPANVSVAGVIKPAVEISHADQEDLNVTTQGKSINAIRSFIGEGALVWGARTLDGNSLDWRYINVRRTMIMLEESCRLAAKAMVFEPNVANTWVTIKSMIGNFLTGIWKRGGLAGAVPDDAFSVHVGLGETMTPEDILEGILRVTVLVAISRPAEFIEITFQQQMQKS